jgi:phosphonate transport system substrate-binding protein
VSPSRLRFATFLSPPIRPLYEHVVVEIGRALGIEASLHAGAAFEELDGGEADAAFICGLPYVERSDRLEALAAPVLRGERFCGRPIYFSDVIVRRGSGLRSLADLRGRSWAFNDRDSQSGYGIMRYTLLSFGATDAFFGDVQCAGSHAEAIRRVAAGEVDGAAIDCQVLAVELRERPGLGERIEVIDAVGPSTIQPVVASRRLPESLRAELREAIAAIRPSAPLARSGVERFVAVADGDYDDIRAMVAACKQAGLLALR